MASKKTEVRRWDVIRADFDPVAGSEQGGVRPAVVISNDGFNRHMPVITVMPLTKLEGKRRGAYAFEIVLPTGSVSAGITTMVLPYQIRTISKLRLRGTLGRITDEVHRAQIEARLLEHLGVELD